MEILIFVVALGVGVLLGYRLGMSVFRANALLEEARKTTLIEDLDSVSVQVEQYLASNDPAKPWWCQECGYDHDDGDC
jgi:predicted Zn-ribbon and HTH transcriptional regulator